MTGTDYNIMSFFKILEYVLIFFKWGRARRDYLYRSKPTNEYKKNQEKKKVVIVTTNKAIIDSRKMDLVMLISLRERILENEIFTESQSISPQITY